MYCCLCLDVDAAVEVEDRGKGLELFRRVRESLVPPESLKSRYSSESEIPSD
jgi:hypothetical protein